MSCWWVSPASARRACCAPCASTCPRSVSASPTATTPPWAGATSTASYVWPLAPKATAAAVFYSVTAQVQELASARVHPVFLLDEAHLLHADVLAHLHILLNYEWDSRALLSLVLVGLPELEDRLCLSTHKSLLSRLHTRLRLEPVTADDSADYLRHRLQLTGCERELFPLDSVSLLHEASLGAHRELDRLASLCLREAARRKRKLIDNDIVRGVLGRQSSSSA
jgi:general secretion pathway protein A